MPVYVAAAGRRRAALVLLTCLLVCGASQARAAPRAYTIDADASDLRVIVPRRGVLAPLAHDHVLVAKGIAGRMTFVPEAIGSSAGQLSIPVAFLDVDDAKARLREGLAAEMTEGNRASVRENMLAADQLNVAEFPRITAVLERAEGSLPNLVLHLRVRIRDQERPLDIPVTVSQSPDTLMISGEMELLQSAFGITPYSTLFGAIAVQDAVRVKFEIVARAANP